MCGVEGACMCRRCLLRWGRSQECCRALRGGGMCARREDQGDRALQPGVARKEGRRRVRLASHLLPLMPRNEAGGNAC